MISIYFYVSERCLQQQQHAQQKRLKDFIFLLNGYKYTRVVPGFQSILKFSLVKAALKKIPIKIKKSIDYQSFEVNLS